MSNSGFQVSNPSRYQSLFLAKVILLGSLMSLNANAQRATEAVQSMMRSDLTLRCEHVFPIVQSYLARHINHERTSKNLETRTTQQFIDRLDASKVYFVAADVATIKKNFEDIFLKTREKNCEPIFKTYAMYIDRVKERAKHVQGYLGEKFKFDPKTTVQLDPEKRVFAKTGKEANQFLETYVQFQISNYLASDTVLGEAKTNVIKNYERVQKRIAETNRQEILTQFLEAFSRSLDPHSSYMSAASLEDFEIQMRLALEGIGATLSSKDGFTVIEQLVAGGAASNSGKLKPKDKIIAVAQGKSGKPENVIDMDLRDVVRKIRGKAGTEVSLTVMRKEGKEVRRFNVSLIRDKIKLEDDAAQIHYIEKAVGKENKKIGLINLPSFYSDSRKNGRSAAKDMKRLVAEAKANKVDGLVLDMSTNGGGSLDDAVKIAGLFFKTGAVVMQSSRDPDRSQIELDDEDSAVDWAGPLVLLTSRVSASASEIVSGTLQDYKRAIVVGGDHTFGKGTVQSVEYLPPGLGALKTTVGMFFTAGGSSTQHRGVDADIVFPSAYSNDDIGEKTLEYSLPPKKIPPFLSKSAFVTEGADKWTQVDEATIKKLREASLKRIDASEKFAEIKKNIEKTLKRGKIVRVGEVLDEKAEKDKKKKIETAKKDGKAPKTPESTPNEKTPEDILGDEADENVALTPEERKKKYLERPDVIEAVNIAADFVTLNTSPTITLGKKEDSRDSKAAGTQNN